jgi:putative ABC transport system permease protein
MLRFERYRILGRLGFRNLRANWRHSFATVLAISLGYAAVSLFDGFVGAIDDFVVESYVNRGMVGHVVVQKKGADGKPTEDPWKFTLDKPQQILIEDLLKNDSRVDLYTRFMSLAGVVSVGGSKQSVFIGVGYDVESGTKMRGDRWRWHTISGRPLASSAEAGGLLGLGLAQKLNCDFDIKNAVARDGSYVPVERMLKCPGASVQLSATTEQLQINALEVKSVGVIDFLIREFNDRFLILPLPMAQRLMDTERINHFAVLLRRSTDASKVIADLNQRFERDQLPIEAIRWLDFPAAAPAKSGLELMGIFRALFLTVVGVIAVMSVANSMMKTINERIREIGTLRSYGFRQADIVFLFLCEGFLLGAFSCASGLMLTAAISFLVNISGLTFNTGLMSNPIPLHINFQLQTWVISLMALSLVAMLTSWVVSRRASKMVIADALRYVS